MKTICFAVNFFISSILKTASTVQASFDEDAIFVILSQQNYRHAQLGDIQRENLMVKLKSRGVQEPQVYDLHNDWTMHGEQRLGQLFETNLLNRNQRIIVS